MSDGYPTPGSYAATHAGQQMDIQNDILQGINVPNEVPLQPSGVMRGYDPGTNSSTYTTSDGRTYHDESDALDHHRNR